mgnify:FL=1
MVAARWFRQRRYMHFDEVLGSKKAHKLVTDPLAVARHAFWPMIQFSVSAAKLKLNKESGSLEKNSKTRDILYAAHGDSQIFSYYCAILSDRYESTINSRGLADVVLAFRSLNKSNIEFAKDAFDEIQKLGDCPATALDGKRFFDNLDHGHLNLS